jgi:hypothetical protein
LDLPRSADSWCFRLQRAIIRCTHSVALPRNGTARHGTARHGAALRRRKRSCSPQRRLSPTAPGRVMLQQGATQHVAARCNTACCSTVQHSVEQDNGTRRCQRCAECPMGLESTRHSRAHGGRAGGRADGVSGQADGRLRNGTRSIAAARIAKVPKGYLGTLQA